MPTLFSLTVSFAVFIIAFIIALLIFLIIDYRKSKTLERSKKSLDNRDMSVIDLSHMERNIKKDIFKHLEKGQHQNSLWGTTTRQVWHKKHVKPTGDTVFFKELHPNIRICNLEESGRIPTTNDYFVKSISLLFDSYLFQSNVQNFFEKSIIRLHIKGDDAYRYVRPTTSNWDSYEFIYEIGLHLKADQVFNVTIHFPPENDSLEVIPVTCVLDYCEKIN